MENILENKVKFFAQYFDQTILSFIGSSVDYNLHPHSLAKNENWNNKTKSIEKQFIVLKPLLQISDEDCLYLSREIFRFTQLKVEEFIIKEIKKLLEYNGQTNISQSEWLKAFDFLRSKGYALPWMGLSVEKLVEYGWVQLKK